MVRRTVALASAVLAACPATASAHALLDRTEPERGATLAAAPERVAFYFNEPVEASFGAIRVFDSEGEQVESGAIERPGGSSEAVAVDFSGELADGTYTATYRVVSADSHPVSGGFVFTVGEAMHGGHGGSQTVSELLAGSDTGSVTSAAFWVARWAGYAALGLAAGAFAFLLLAWRGGLRQVGGGGEEWSEAREAFTGRVRTLLLAAALAGLASSLAAIVLQGATAAGTSFWSACDPEVIADVLETRFGAIAGIRALAWAVVAGALFLPALRSVSTLRPFGLGATGSARRGVGVLSLAAIAVPLVFLTLAPGLSGHASTQDPGWLLLPADIVHVAAMSLWFGGLAALVFVVPAATGRLPREERTRLLAAVLTRFSPLALGAVIALAATGIAQSIVYLGSLGDLVDTGFGRAILVKAGLLCALIGLGALNRQRTLPALRQLAERGEAPAGAGLVLRRTIRAEVTLIVAVLAVAAALVSYAPPSEAEQGPVTGSTELGPALLEYTIDPAEPGSNLLHLYLFDAETGAQLSAAKNVRVHMSMPADDIGPIEAELDRAGPGHWVARSAPFGVAGEWTMEVSMRVSRFEQAVAEVDVAIE